MIDAKTMSFLAGSARDPTREWLAAHKKDLEDAKADLKQFASLLIQGAASIDGRVSSANPDLTNRFARVLGAQLAKGIISLTIRTSPDPRAAATYFVHIEPGVSYSGGGARSPATKFSRLLRQQMMTDTGRWRELVEGTVFRTFFPYGLSDGNSPATSGFGKNHDAMDSLNLRAFGACRPLPDQLLQSSNAVSEIVRAFAAARPLIDFINRATTR